MPHGNTVLSQLLKLIDRHDFKKLGNGKFKPKRKYRSLSLWSQFTAMIFAQITGRVSLRDISASLQVPSRQTVSPRNQLCEEINSCRCQQPSSC